MTTRFTLHDQLHFLATVAGHGAVVVTMQHWKNRDGSTAVYVVTYNGAEHSRKFADDPRDVASLAEHFTTVRTDRAEDLLSEAGAVDEVVRRGGPNPTHCLKADCTSTIPIPYAAAHCAAGCLPAEERGGLEFMSVTNGRPAMKLVTGGKK